MGLHLLAALICAPQDTPAPINLEQVAGVYTPGDVGTLTVSEDGERAFVVEGGAIRELRLSTMIRSAEVTYLQDVPGGEAPSDLLSLRPIEATVMELLHVGDSLLVAGGSYGVLMADVSDAAGTAPATEFERVDPAPWESRTVEALTPPYSADPPVPANLWCMDLVEWKPGPTVEDRASETQRERWVLALHASRKGAHIQVLRPVGGSSAYETFAWIGGLEGWSTPPPIADGNLQQPLAYALTLEEDADQAYVALGTGGIVRVDLTHLTRTPAGKAVVRERLVFDRADLPANVSSNSDLGFDSNHPAADACARVRDVAVEAGRLYAAADDLGVISSALPVRAIDPWGEGPHGFGLEQVKLTFHHKQVVEPGVCAFVEGQAPYHSFAIRLAAVSDGERVLLAVRGDPHPVKALSEAAPSTAFCRWTWDLVPGIPTEAYRRTSVRAYPALYLLEDPIEDRGQADPLHDMVIAAAILHGEGRDECDQGKAPLRLPRVSEGYGIGYMTARLVPANSEESGALRLYRTVAQSHASYDDREVGFLVEDYELSSIDGNPYSETRRRTRGAFTTFGVAAFSAEPSLVDEDVLFVSAEPAFGFNPLPVTDKKSNSHCPLPAPGVWTTTGLVTIGSKGEPLPPAGQSYSLDFIPDAPSSGKHGLFPIQAHWVEQANEQNLGACALELMSGVATDSLLDVTVTGRSQLWRLQMHDVSRAGLANVESTWRFDMRSPAFPAASGSNYRSATLSGLSASDTIALSQHRVQLGGATTSRRAILRALQEHCVSPPCEDGEALCCSPIPLDCAEDRQRPACEIAPAMKMVETHPELEGLVAGTHYPASGPITTDVQIFEADLGGEKSEIALYSCGYFFANAMPDASGSDVELADFSRGMIVLVDLTGGGARKVPALPAHLITATSSHLSPFAIGLSSGKNCNIIRTEIVEVDGHRFAVCADVGGSVVQFDLSDKVLEALRAEAASTTPSDWRRADNTNIPVLPAVSSWRAQRLRSDGGDANIIDVLHETSELRANRHYLYVSDARSGLFRLTLGRSEQDPEANCECGEDDSCEVLEEVLVPVDQTGAQLLPMNRLIFPRANNPLVPCNGVEFFDTPGLPHFLTLRETAEPGRRRLFVGDKKNGLRVYTND